MRSNLVQMNMSGQTPMRFSQQPQQQPLPPSGVKRPMTQLPPPPGINQMNQQSRQQQIRNRKRRNLDRAIMTEIADAYPEGQSYVDLLAIEARLDALLLRKRMNVQEALKRPQKMKKKMRVFISHVFLPGREPRDGDQGSVPMWELRVEGRLVEDCAPNQLDLPPSQVPNAQSIAAQRNKRKFSTFFKSLVIELDKEIYGPDNHLVEWHRSPHTNETDGFQVKRPGDRDVTCTILLSLDYQPMKYKLQSGLAKLLGIALETRPKVIEALWQYIRSHNLQDVKSRDYINCDDMLEKIFQTKRMRFMEIPQRVHALLSPPDPIVIRHIIKKTDNEKPVTSCYDIDVDIDDPLRTSMTQFLNSMGNTNEIHNLDMKLYELAEQVSEWKQRVDYYKRFADEPRDFLVKWLQSQEADLKNMAAHGEFKGMKNPFPEQPLQAVDRYLQPDMQEGVFRYFYNRICRLRKELEMGINTKTYV